jgi:hypothetical protein
MEIIFVCEIGNLIRSVNEVTRQKSEKTPDKESTPCVTV